MTKGGKQFLGWLFLVLAIPFCVGYVVGNYKYSGTAGVLLAIAASVMFKMASNDKTSPGLSFPRPAPCEAEAAAKGAEKESGESS
jgi:hypothetical protein